MGSERRPLEIANRQREARPRRADIRLLVDHLLDREGEQRGIGVALVGPRTIRRLHRDWLDDDSPTDVISFPDVPEGKGSLSTGALVGEVVICVSVCAESSARRGVGLEDEVARVLIHGALHLIGYDHESKRERRAMRAKERSYLAWARARGLRVVVPR